MHRTPAATNNLYTAITATIAFLLLTLSTAQAATSAIAQAEETLKAVAGGSTISPAAQAAVQNAMAQQVKAGLAPKTQAASSGKKEEEEQRSKYLGDANDPNSPLGKAMLLAQKSEKERKLHKGEERDEDSQMVELAPPPGIEKLQYIKEHMGDADSIVDDGAHGKMAEDMRRQAMREAALSYGARGGLAKRSYEINERTRDFAHAMDQVFNFRSLLIKAPSGMLIEPPIVKETLENLLIEKNGSEAAMAQGVFDINKNAKIVSAPRDWRQYLVQPWTETIAPPPKTLWPRTDKEQMLWNTWVEQGWRAGLEQADKIFEMNTNRLTADYQGMVRYRVLLAQGMISAPYATLEERGVTGDDNQLRIGDTAIRITSPSQFIIGANTWRPADR